VLVPIPSTLRSISFHQPSVTSQVRLFLASVENSTKHSYKSQKWIAPNAGFDIVFVPYQNFRPRWRFDYGQFRLDLLSRSVPLQCMGCAMCKTFGKRYGRCQQVTLSNGFTKWLVTCRVWPTAMYLISLCIPYRHTGMTWSNVAEA
jgi:hypothetical protein